MRAPVTALITLLLALGGLTPMASAAASDEPTFSGASRIPATDDFASAAYADPWDFASGSDLVLDRGPTQNLTSLRFQGGALRFSASQSGYVSLVFPGYYGALPFGRDGAVNPVNATHFTHAAVRMYSSGAMGGALFWDRCTRSYSDVCRGQHMWSLREGWHTYVLPLRDLTVGKQTYGWEGTVNGLRLAVGPSSSHNFAVDWVRLYRPGAGAEVPVSWQNPSPGSSATIVWDGDADPANNTSGNHGWGILGTSTAASGSTAFPAAAFPPGTYRFYVESGGRRTALSRALVIDGRPLIEVLDPDEAGGEDYATARRGDPWDLNSRADVDYWGNATSVAFSGGAMHATNAGPTKNDPFVWLKLASGGIDSTRYHRMTIDFDYDGPFALEDTAGGGAHGRVVWFRNGDRSTVHQSKEIVTYSGRRRYTFDLSTTPASAVMETDRPSRAGWPGAKVTGFRWDPNEDRGSRRWRIHDVKLRADDETRGNEFTISWQDHGHQAGTTVSLYYDTDDGGANGTLIAAGVPQQAGVNRYRWWTGNVPSGRYHVYAVADDGLSRQRAYSTGPVRVVRSATPAPLPSWGSWATAGSGVASAPAAVSWDAARTDLFAVDHDGQLVHRWRTGGGWAPAGWENLGAPPGRRLVGAPTATSQSRRSLDVFARGDDDALWHRYFRPGSGWSRWETLGGKIAGPPSATSWQPGRIDVIAPTADGTLAHRYWRPGWSRWENLGGDVTSAASIASWGPRRLDIFVRGADGSLQHRYYDTTRWSGWASRGGQLAGDGRPEATSAAFGRLDVALVGGGNGVYHQAYERGWGWMPTGAYARLGAPAGPLVSGVGASSRGLRMAEVFVTAADGTVWRRATR